ncbi:MAG TPA: FG-GAP-like repeat-containing protein, partial [Myxococcales bacterium]|nr:FG-GAP-like repeat-containing protein [Myxococcales bacterium]
QNNSAATQGLQIVVYPPCGITTTSLADGYTTTAYSVALAGSGGKPPYSWSVTAGSLPGGLALTPGTGSIDGTPASPGTTGFTVTLSDVNGVTASQALSVAVFNLPQVTTPSPLQDGYVTQAYSATLNVSGGKSPFTWGLSTGTLPGGLSLSTSGTIGAGIGLGPANGQGFSFTAQVTDANGKVATRAYTMTAYLLPQVTNAALTPATEGITYMAAPGAFVQITAANGKAPYAYSATNLPLAVQQAQPIRTGGANATAPTGSPITDALTVFIIDGSGNGMSGVGVRVRKNGVELGPAQTTTNGAGKAFFSGLGFNGTTDTADITANGPGLTTTTLAGVNAALVTLSPNRLDAPPVRAGFSAAFDPSARLLFVTMGTGGYRSASAFSRNGCLTDVQRLTSASPSATWSLDVQGGMNAAPPGRTDAVFAYSSATPAGEYLFGGAGCNGVPLNDLWKYNSASKTWGQITPGPGTPVPGPRQMAAMAADASGRLLLFGGLLPGGAASSELWRFDPAGSTWTSLGGVPPLPRFGMGYAAVGGELWVCGGFAGMLSQSLVADCYSVDASGNWVNRPSLPSPRALLSLAADSSGGVYAFGGRTSSGDTSELLYTNGLSNWTSVPVLGGDPVASRERASMHFNSGKLVVVGGNRDGEATGMNDVDVFDTGTGQWAHTSPNPQPSTGFTLSGTIRTGGFTRLLGPDGGTGIGPGGTAYVQVTTSSGWDGSAVTTLQGGAGSYSISGIPPGDTITVNAYLVDTSKPFPNSLSTGIDYGVIGPINANTTQDINFPLAPAVSTATGSVAFPSGWNVWSLFAQPYQSRVGYPFLRASNGLGHTDSSTGFTLASFPPFAPGQQDATAGGLTTTPGACEVSVHSLPGIGGGTLPATTLLTPPRGLAPGLNECTPRGSASQLAGAAIYRPGNGTPSPAGMAVADLNGDTVPDLVVSDNGTGQAVQVLFGRGDGTFDTGNAVTIPVSGTPNGVALGRLGGETNLSIVVAERSLTNPVVEVFRGDGAGHFAPAGAYGVGQDPWAVIITADLNADGFPDLVTSNSGSGTLSILASRPGGFNVAVTVNACNQPHGLAAANFDQDGFTDLAVACQGSGASLDNRVLIFRGVSTASPYVAGTSTAIATGVPFSGPFALVAADFDGDTAADLATTNTGTGPAVTFWKNQRSGSIAFQPPLSLGPGGGAANVQGLAAANVNGDSFLDLVAASTGADQVLAFRGDGLGGFNQLQTLGTPDGPVWLAAGDLNGDGRADAVVSCGAAGAVEVMLQARPLGTNAEGAYSFNVPAGMGAVQLVRGPELQWMDWQYLTPVANGLTSLSITLPAASTLVSSPPAPPGQIVGWTVQGYKGAAGSVDLNNFRFGLLRADDQVQAGAALYVRQ